MARIAWRKVAAALVWTAGGVLLLGVIALACAPFWLRLEPVRKRIESAASAALGGPVRFGRIDFSWFPRPEVVVRRAEVSAPGKVSGTVRSARIRPALLPLLRGRVRFSSLKVDGLDLTFLIPDRTDAAQPAGPSDPTALVAPLLSPLAALEPGLTADVTGGRVVFSRRGKIVAAVHDLEAHVGFPSNDVWLNLKCRSDFFALPAGGATITGGAIDVGVDAVLREDRTLHAGLKVSAPSVSLRRPNRRALAIAGLGVEGAIDLGIGRTDLRISRLSLASPRLQAEGAYRVDAGLPHAEVTATGGLDVTSLRKELLSFAGDDPTIAGIFGIVRAGTLRSFSFAAEGRTPAELGMLERMSIRGALADGAVRLEGQQLDFEGTRADVSLDGALLSAKNAAARLGNSRVSDGSVRVGLGTNDRRLRVEARVDADLAELVPILSRVIPRGAFSEELSLVEDLAGSAVGRITIGNRVGALKTNVRVSEMHLSARYERIPWPLRIRGAAFFYDGQRIGVGGLVGSAGGSTISGLAATVRLEDPALLEELSGTVESPLDESFPWLASRPGMQTLQEGVRRLGGSLTLSVDRLTGPVSRPADLVGEATVRLGDVVVDTPLLRVPLEIASGEFQLGLAGGGALSLAGTSTLRDGPRVDFDLARDAEGTNVRDLTIADGDAVASVAADLRKDTIDIRFKGRLLAATLSRFLPEPQRRTGWVAGELRAVLPRRDLRQAMADGTLEAADLDVPTPAGPVTIESLDLRATRNRFEVFSSAVLDRQRFTTAGTATLRGDGIALDMEVATHDLAWERVDASLRRLEEGKAEAAPAAPAGPRTSAPSPFAVSGGLRLCVGSFAFGRLAWKDVRGVVVFGKDSVGADVQSAELCGVSTTGRLELLPGGAIAVDAGAASAGPNLGAPLTCLGFKSTLAGRYEMNVRVQGEAQAAELPRAVHGAATIRAWDGGFGKAGLLAKIGKTLRSANVFSGKKDPFGEANNFDELFVQGDLADGAFSIREAVLKTPSLTMVGSGAIGYVDRSVDLVVLAYPLSTVDKVIQAIPVVRYIAGKDFLSVAVRVTGGLEDPKVAVTPGQDVARGLVNMLARTVKLPVEVFSPPSP